MLQKDNAHFFFKFKARKPHFNLSKEDIAKLSNHFNGEGFKNSNRNLS